MANTAPIVGRLFLSLFFEIISAPLWWYSRGLFWVMKSVGSSIADTAAAAGLGLWVRNIFVPMYGQHDVWGRIVSFIIRLPNIVGRSMWGRFWGLFWGVVVRALVP